MNKRVIKRNVSTSVEFGKVVNLYLQALKAKGAVEDTIEGMTIALEIFTADMGIDESDPIDVITKEMVTEWANILINKGKKVSTVNTYLSRLRMLMYWAMENDYLEPYKIKLVKGQEETIKYFTDDELEVLIKKPDRKCDFVEYRTWVIICFILATGARASTISNIMMDDVDFKMHTVTYRHLKNKKVAVIPLSAQICKVLNEYLKEWDTGSEYLFCDVGGGILTSSAIRQALIKYCKKRSIQPLGPHALRHSFARGWIRNGGGVFQLQQMLTHADLQMTRRYVQLFSDDLVDDVKLFSPLDSMKHNSRTKTVTRRF